MVRTDTGEPVMVWQRDGPHPRSAAHLREHLGVAGLSLPIIGALLGHTQPQTTARYTHLLDDPLRAATEHVGAVVTANAEKSADCGEHISKAVNG